MKIQSYLKDCDLKNSLLSDPSTQTALVHCLPNLDM